MARSHGADLLSGEGLDDALAGVDAVVDVSDLKTVRRRSAVRFFETAGRHLLAAEERAGVRHHVALSIVGVDRVDWGYYEGKRRQEDLVRAGAVPWTVLRATQFHEFPAQLLARVPGPVAPVPRMRVQPVAVREVAVVLAELATGPALGDAPELAGPREESVPDMARRLLSARGSHRLVVPVRLPGAAGRAMAGRRAAARRRRAARRPELPRVARRRPRPGARVSGGAPPVRQDGRRHCLPPQPQNASASAVPVNAAPSPAARLPTTLATA